MSDVKSFQSVFDETVIFFNTFMCEDHRLEITEKKLFDELKNIFKSFRSDFELNNLHYLLLIDLMRTSEAIEFSNDNDGPVFKGVGLKTDLKDLNQKLRDEQKEQIEVAE